MSAVTVAEQLVCIVFMCFSVFYFALIIKAVGDLAGEPAGPPGECACMLGTWAPGCLARVPRPA